MNALKYLGILFVGIALGGGYVFQFIDKPFKSQGEEAVAAAKAQIGGIETESATAIQAIKSRTKTTLETMTVAQADKVTDLQAQLAAAQGKLATVQGDSDAEKARRLELAQKLDELRVKLASANVTLTAAEAAPAPEPPKPEKKAAPSARDLLRQDLADAQDDLDEAKRKKAEWDSNSWKPENKGKQTPPEISAQRIRNLEDLVAKLKFDLGGR